MIGYCGLGLQRRMLNTDMMIAVANGYNSSIQDHYSYFHYTPPLDTILGGRNDLIQLNEGYDSNGFIDITFERKLSTGDKYDQIILIDEIMEIC